LSSFGHPEKSLKLCGRSRRLDGDSISVLFTCVSDIGSQFRDSRRFTAPSMLVNRVVGKKIRKTWYSLASTVGKFIFMGDTADSLKRRAPRENASWIYVLFPLALSLANSIKYAEEESIMKAFVKDAATPRIPADCPSLIN